MLKILSYLLKNGVATVKEPPTFLENGVRGLPKIAQPESRPGASVRGIMSHQCNKYKCTR